MVINTDPVCAQKRAGHNTRIGAKMKAAPEIIRAAIPEVWVIRPRAFPDNRGSFSETYNAATFAQVGVQFTFVQDNQSISARRGTVRGLHFQIPPMAQAKVVRVVKGAVLDVAVDLRQGSPTYGQHVSRVLSAANQEQLFLPPGFAHGFCTREDDTTVLYKVSNLYSPLHERGVRWNDPLLAIDWGVTQAEALLSARDQAHPGMAELMPFFEYAG
jgi:dTDP-4-dehydrorhamnose 3,5-epimerase